MSKFYRLLSVLVLLWLTGCTLLFQPKPSAPASPQIWSGTPVPTAIATLSAENAQQVVEIARWGKGRISDLAWSPDSQQLAVGTTTGLFLFDATTCQQIKYLPTRYGVTHLLFSPDGKSIFTGDEYPGNDARLWDVTSGQQVRDFRGSGSVGGFALSPDSQILVVSGNNNRIEVWNARTGSKQPDLEEVRLYSAGDVAISPDGAILAAADYQQVWLWSLQTGKRLKVLSPQYEARLVAFSPDGSVLATDACGEQADQTICSAGEIWLWNTSTWQPVTKLRGHRGWIESIAFSPDGTRLVSGGSRDYSLKLWDVKTGQLLNSVVQQTAYIDEVAFSPDGARLASASRDSGVTLRSADTLAQICVLDGYTDTVNDVTLSADGKSIAVGSPYGVRLLDMTQGNLQGVFTATIDYNFEGHSALSAAANSLAYGDSTGNVQVWSLPDGKPNYALPVPNDAHRLVYSPVGNLLVVNSTSGSLSFWDSVTGQPAGIQSGVQPAIPPADTIAVSPDGKLLAVATKEEGPIRLWDIATQQVVQSMVGDVHGIESLTFSPDGKLLAAGSSDQLVRLWATGTGQQLYELDGHAERVYAVAFSPDGKLLASGSRDQIIRIWNVQTGRSLKVLDSHAGAVTALAFLPDNSYLISGSEDGSLRLWGIPAKTPLK